MKAEFVKSAASPEQFIRDGRKSIVFAGRSNVGKSSVINLLTGQKNLARVGNTPGKTAHINYFLIDERYYYIDLPGYGYAKVSHAERQRWAELLEAFFARPELITYGLLVTDARHVPTELDRQMCGLFRQSEIPFTVIANKADKLKPSQLTLSLQTIQETLGSQILPFSAATGLGKQEVLHEFHIRIL